MVEKEYFIVDTHTAGEPTRVVTNFPPVHGATMADIKKEMQTNHDWFRQFLLREPRGHTDMFGAILFPPVRKNCDIGVIFMDNGGYLDMCGHGIIGLVTCIVQIGLIEPKAEILIDTPTGAIATRIDYHNNRVRSVSFQNVPAFKVRTTKVNIEGRLTPVDIAFGGNFFAHVYASSLGITLEPSSKGVIIDLALKIRREVNAREKVAHPQQPQINKVELVEFSAPPKSEGADARNVVVFGQGQIDRSPCGTGTCAKMALLHSEGKLKIGETFVHEGILQTKFTGRLLRETKVGDYHAVLPEITGSAYITGRSRLVYDDKDPLIQGFLL